MKEVFWPLKMRDTGYLPQDGNIAATEMQDDGRCLQGVVHDENARFLGGVAGNAGVFGNMDDLALFLQMLCRRGQLPDGTHYLCPATVELAMRNHTPGMAQGRGLSFYLPAYDNGYTGDLFPRETVGHTGFTGTSFALDPTSGLYVIFLTNRKMCIRDRGISLPKRRRAHAGFSPTTDPVQTHAPVSYTHLDVYKRQALHCRMAAAGGCHAAGCCLCAVTNESKRKFVPVQGTAQAGTCLLYTSAPRPAW